MYFVLIMEKVQTGQVIEFYSNSCLVKTNLGEFNCIAIKNIVVGDFVQLEIIQDSKKPLGKITKVNKRSSVLSRRDGNKNKLFAANVTHVGILVTPNPKTTTEFIDKWIVTAILSGITPFIINNKIDLNQDDNYQSKLNIYKNLDIKLIEISAKNKSNLDELIKYLESDCVVFVGNSGAGKSTLTSSITGKKIKTNVLSNNQGVHTTSISSLYETNKGTKIIDSPGVRDLPIAGWDKEEIIRGFSEIFLISKDCKFNDCNHINNEGCAVTASLNDGVISESRYNNFINFRDNNENE